jgi:regulator of replication initiation timing
MAKANKRKTKHMTDEMLQDAVVEAMTDLVKQTNKVDMKSHQGLQDVINANKHLHLTLEQLRQRVLLNRPIHNKGQKSPAKTWPVKEVKREPKRQPAKGGLASTVGFGGYPNDCCQNCGYYLREACYSKNQNAKTVPKKNKICSDCYKALPPKQKKLWKKYEYRPGHEASGVGWNANKPYGKAKGASGHS